MQYLDAISKQQNNLCLFPRQTIQYHSNPSLYPNRQCRRGWNRIVLWRPTRPSRTNTQKRCPFHYRGLECKSRKSRNTWSNRQIWPWNMEWSRAKTNRVLPRKCTGHNKHPLPTTQEKTLHMDITRWSILKSDIDYILCNQRWRSSVQSAKARQFQKNIYFCFIDYAKPLTVWVTVKWPRPNLPVTSGVSWLPTFAFQSLIMKRASFLGVSSKRSCRSS